MSRRVRFKLVVELDPRPDALGRDVTARLALARKLLPRAFGVEVLDVAPITAAEAHQHADTPLLTRITRAERPAQPDQTTPRPKTPVSTGECRTEPTR